MARILIVDDEPGLRSLLRSLLEDGGHDVLEASGGWAALELLGREALDVLMLDITLGDIEGMAVLRRVRADPRLHDLPVIMLSGHSEKATVDEARALGASAYLTKPFDRDAVARALAEAFPSE
jgi:CheY-like chemotaxis protein